MADAKKQKKFWALAGIFGFASFISFFQINSYAADKHHLNTVWIIAGIVAGLASIYCMGQAFKNSGGDSFQER